MPAFDLVDVHVGRRVRHMRIIANLTQEELGEKIGVSYQQIQKYETGANRVSASKLYRIAIECAVAPGWFFEGLPDCPVGDEPTALFAVAG